MNPISNLPSATPPATGGAGQTARIKKAAQEFEGILINTLWSSFQQDPMFGSDDDDDSDPGAGSIRGMGLQAVSSAIANNGGLGIANMIERQLSPHAGAAEKPTSNGQGNLAPRPGLPLHSESTGAPNHSLRSVSRQVTELQRGSQIP